MKSIKSAYENLKHDQLVASFIPLFCFFAAALILLVNWNRHNLYPITGDEPHYLVIASGIAKYGTLEVTRAYQDEFETPRFHPGLGQPGDEPVLHNAHAIRGPNGAYSTHNVGLPFLLTPLVAFGGGALCARLFMLLLSLLLPVFVWCSVTTFIKSTFHRVVVVTTITLSAPFIYSAGQIYPDLVAGVIFGFVALGLVREHLDRLTAYEARAWLPTFLSALMLAFTPWLHLKLVAPLVICLAARLFLSVAASTRRHLAIATIWVLFSAGSLAVLALYNRNAFGAFTGPYGGDELVALEVSLTALAVVFGLHVDQFQGIFLKAPILLAAIVGTADLIRREWRVATFLLLLYGSLVLPNAMQPAWYGGYCFAGRYVLSGAIILVIPTVYGISRLLHSAPRLVICLCIAHLGLQAFLWDGYRLGSPILYNMQQFDHTFFQTFFFPIRYYLPYFDLRDLTVHLWTNIGWLVAISCLFVGSLLITRSGPPKAAKYWLAAAPTAIIFASIGVLSTGGSARLSSVTFDATELPSLSGAIEQGGRAAREGRDPAGVLTYGPYIVLSPGLYKFRMEYLRSRCEGRNRGHVGRGDQLRYTNFSWIVSWD